MSPNVDLELIRELHPQSAGASSEARERARAELMNEIAKASQPRQRRKPERLRLPLLPSIGLVGTAVIVLAALLLATELRGGAAHPASAAAAVLERAARTAEASSGPRELRPSEYWYVESRETTAGVLLAGGNPARPRQIIDALGTVVRQVWLSRDRPSAFKERVVGPIRFLSAAARKQWVRDGRPPQLDRPGYVSLGTGHSFVLPYKQLLALPTNVDAL